MCVGVVGVSLSLKVWWCVCVNKEGNASNKIEVNTNCSWFVYTRTRTNNKEVFYNKLNNNNNRNRFVWGLVVWVVFSPAGRQ